MHLIICNLRNPRNLVTPASQLSEDNNDDPTLGVELLDLALLVLKMAELALHETPRISPSAVPAKVPLPLGEDGSVLKKVDEADVKPKEGQGTAVGEAGAEASTPGGPVSNDAAATAALYGGHSHATFNLLNQGAPSGMLGEIVLCTLRAAAVSMATMNVADLTMDDPLSIQRALGAMTNITTSSSAPTSSDRSRGSDGRMVLDQLISAFGEEPTVFVGCSNLFCVALDKMSESSLDLRYTSG